MSQSNHHKDRAELLQQMTCPTRQVAGYIQTALAAENQQSLLLRHDIGSRLRQVVEEKATYGSQAVSLLGEYLALRRTRLRRVADGPSGDRYTAGHNIVWKRSPMDRTPPPATDARAERVIRGRAIIKDIVTHVPSSDDTAAR